MNTEKSAQLKSAPAFHTCGSCGITYREHKVLLAHLFWRHGTESIWCGKCGLKRWRFAVHICHALPYDENDFVQHSICHSPIPARNTPTKHEPVYCFCGKFIEQSSMIGCDGKNCLWQWFHFSCVGIATPPEGDWFCPVCAKLETTELDANGT